MHHHNTIKTVGDSAETPIEIDIQPAASESPVNRNTRKRKSDVTDSSGGPPGQESRSGTAKKPRTKFRLEMEEKHGEYGVDIEHNMGTQYITLHVTERASYDKYVKLHITGGHAPTRGA